MTQMLTRDDLHGRPLIDLVLVRTVHFDGLFRDEEKLTEVTLEHLNSVLRHRLVHLLTEYGDDRAILANELDAWRGLVPHAWAEENPKWALVFTTYADTIASAGAVAATKARHPPRKSFLVQRRASLMKKSGFTLIGE